MTASAARAASPGARWRSTGSIEEFTEVALEVAVGCIGEFAARNNDDVEAAVWFQVAEKFACEPFGPVPGDCSTNLASSRDTQPGMITTIGSDEKCHEPAAEADTRLVGALEIHASPDMFWRPESRHDPLPRRHQGPACVPRNYRSSETVSRFRPFARRRFRTC